MPSNKLTRKNCQTFNICQSGEISPNLITLLTAYNYLSKTPELLPFYELEDVTKSGDKKFLLFRGSLGLVVMG